MKKKELEKVVRGIKRLVVVTFIVILVANFITIVSQDFDIVDYFVYGTRQKCTLAPLFTKRYIAGFGFDLAVAASDLVGYFFKGGNSNEE